MLDTKARTPADLIVRRTLRGSWPTLPALAVASTTLCAAATVALLISPGLNPLAVLSYALLCAPPFAAVAAVANEAAFGRDAGLTRWLRALRAHAGFAVRQALLPATPAVLLLCALQVWHRTGAIWVLPSVALCAAASLLSMLIFLAVVPLGVARPELRGRRLWFTAGFLVARRPSRFVAVLCVAGMGLWLAVQVSASVLLLVPAPAALVVVAAVWTTVAEVAGPEAVPSDPDTV